MTSETSVTKAFMLSGFLTTFIFVSVLATKPQTVLHSAYLAVGSILFMSFIFLSTDSALVFFFCFELLLLVSLFLLSLTSKSERVVEASVEMFFWTLCGSLALLTLFSWLFTTGNAGLTFSSAAPSPSPIFVLLMVVGFGVKVPVWPFYSWLLKAHVEASVEFSMLLSGFIVKLGVYGLYKLLSNFGSSWATHFFFGMCCLGLVMATFRLFGQRDLKRVVALTTVVEMNWLGLCLALGGSSFDALVVYIVVVHSLTTALEFLAVEVLSKSFGSRDLFFISGLFQNLPHLAVTTFMVVLMTIGFPGTPLFFAKFWFFSALASLSLGLVLLLSVLLVLVVPLFFMSLWAPMWFGLPQSSTLWAYDLTSTEAYLFAVLAVSALCLAWWPGLMLSL